MKAINFIKRELPLWIIIFIPIVYMIISWNALPEKMPIHWNIKGEIDRHGSKLMFPLMMGGIYILLFIIPFIDPKKNNYKYFSKVYYIIRVILLSFFSVIQCSVIASGLGIKLNMNRIIVSGLLIVFMILGNYMGNIKHNWFVGIRTPWTLSNETVWRKTHFLAAKLWFWVCLIGLGISFFISGTGLFILLLIIVSTICLIPIIYSYIIFKSL